MPRLACIDSTHATLMQHPKKLIGAGFFVIAIFIVLMCYQEPKRYPPVLSAHASHSMTRYTAKESST
jgi:hypothetical protein